ncbi:MAG TPA: DedA family protein [Candidatus Deferrimicrobiaceae bacterium]|nr:DedA family protein [Candidatus Deferrimicrobiaceae bacterium]HJX72931.1 DedA family protein [Candidatus Deferrimicrobiaceae bacterium]
MTLDLFIHQYGYLALVVGTILEGEVILILGGFAAHQGYLELPWVILAGFAGSLTGDQFFFFLGRWKGTAFLEKKKGWTDRAERIRAWVREYQTLITLGFRFVFVYGFRTVTPLFLGMSRMPAARFMALNVISALLWATLIGTGGYLFGAALKMFVADVKRYEGKAIAAIVATGALIHAVRTIRKKVRGRFDDRGTLPPGP